MSHVSLLKVAGLHTNSNELSAVPEGALSVADNVVVRAKDVIEPRRGQRVSTDLPDVATQVFPYAEDFIFHDQADNLSRVTDGVTETYTGTYTPPSDEQRMRSLETSGNVYFTTDRGVYKLDEVTGTPSPAGAPKTIDLPGIFNTRRDLGSTLPGFLAAGFKVGYRIAFVEKDANNNLLIGSPSGRCMSTNTHATDSTNVWVFVTLPSWVTAGMYLRVYRTRQFESTVDPGDEMNLVKEVQLTAAHISDGTYSGEDSQPDDFRGVALYTNNSSGEGILQANEPPPMCNDIAFWNNRTWFANTAQPQRVFLDLLGTGKGASGSTGIKLGDTLTIAGQKYVGYFTGDGETFPTLDYVGFPVYSSSYGTATFGSVSQDIESTARYLINAINTEGSPSQSIRAYYVSGANDVPGKIVIEASEPNTAPFSVTIDSYAQQIQSLTRVGTTVTVTTVSMHGKEVGDTVLISATTPNANFSVGTKTVTSRPNNYTFTYTEAGTATTVSGVIPNYRVKITSPNPGLAWNPELPKTDGTSGFTVESEAEIEPQRLYYSKIQQPEAVPLVNWIDVGIKGRKILRIIALRDKLFVFKEDGIYLVSGEAPFATDLLDNTVHLLAPDTACTVSNQIFGLTNQGVVSVSESGVNVVSRAIESSLIQLLNPDLVDFTQVNSFGVSRETDRMYELWVPVLDSDDSNPGQAFVYNTMLGVWTRGAVLNRTCGVVNPVTDVLCLGSTGEDVYMERRDLDSLDYYDSLLTGIPVNNLNTSTRTITIPLGYNAINPGDVFTDSLDSSNAFIVESVDYDTEVTITYSDTTGPLIEQPITIKVYTAIPCEVEWATQSAGNANDLKQFTEVKFIFRKAQFISGKAAFSSDVVPERTEIEFEGEATNLFDAVRWGSYDLPIVKRVMVDSQHQYATFFRPALRIREALSYWTLSGICVNFQPVSSVNGQ